MICSDVGCPECGESGWETERGVERSGCPICGSSRLDAAPLYDPPDGAGRRIEGRAGFVVRSVWSPPLLSAREAGWILDAYHWFLTHLGDAAHAERTRLVEPIDAHFVADPADAMAVAREGEAARAVDDRSVRDAALARRLFEACKRHTGLADWDCVLEARASELDDDVAAKRVFFPGDGGPAGTYHAAEDADDVPTIGYDPRLVAEPEVLVATFAHELAHGLLDTVDEPPPGGEDFEEPITDLAAVFLGFGIFLCNSAFAFRQDFDGQWMSWQTTTHGYLPEDTLAFALALFVRVHALDPSIALGHLDGSPRRYLREALAQLDSIPEEVAALKTRLWSARARVA